jgi:hypothetical protein
MSVALDKGLEVTALHNHFFFDEPKVYFMHIGGDAPVGLIVYNALYQWLKFCHGEKHLWFPPAVKPSAAA